MIKTHACYTIHCHVCGEAPDYDGGTLHYETEQAAYGNARDVYEWTVTRDGRVYCDSSCSLSKPDCVCPVPDDCRYCAAVGCLCQLHAEVKVSVLDGQQEIPAGGNGNG